MLLGYEIGVGIYFAADIPSSDLYGVDQVILESYQPGFAGNNIGVTPSSHLRGRPEPVSSPVISNSGNVAPPSAAVLPVDLGEPGPDRLPGNRPAPGLSLNATTA